jgi:hypothetical protein
VVLILDEIELLLDPLQRLGDADLHGHGVRSALQGEGRGLGTG